MARLVTTLYSRAALLTASAGLAGCCLIWGSMTPIVKVLTTHVDLWFLSAMRYLLALPVFWLAWAMARRPATSPAALRVDRTFSLGFAMCAFSVLYTFGVYHSHPVTAAIVLNLGPVISAIMARVLVGARTAPGFPLALSLGLTGAAMVVVGSPGFGARGFGFEGGEPLLIVAQIGWQWYSIRAQQWLGDRGQIALTAITATAAGILMAGFYGTLYSFGLAGGMPASWSTADLAALVWICVFGVAIATLLWNFGVSRLTLPIAALHMNGAPVVAVLTAWALGMPPSGVLVLGGVVVLSGIVYMQTRQLATVPA